MKHLLLFGLALVGTGALAADESALVKIPDTGTETSTATSTSTSTASTAAKSALQKKFGEAWKATKGNDDLLVDERIKGETGKEVNVSQEEAYTMGSDVFYQCAEVSSEGRKDEVCAGDPNNPECAGVAGSIANATNCLEYFTPKSLGCKTYGTSEYSQVEWFAVGDLFVEKIKDCKATKDEYDAKLASTVKLDSLTEVIGAGNYLQNLGSAPSMKGASFNTNSKISGNIKSEMELGSTNWEELAARVKDGASYLGYQDGDIIRASIKGESFASIVKQSPFVKSQLNYEQRANLEEGLADSKMISQRVVQSYREKSGQEALAEAPAPARAGEENGGNQPNRPADSAPINATGGAVAPGSVGGPIAEAKGTALGGANAPPATDANSRAMLEAERQEAVAQAAALARAEKRAYRSPASLAQSPVEDLLHASLFQRISQAYRRKSSGMKSFDTRSGDVIRSIEKPEIFRSL